MPDCCFVANTVNLNFQWLVALISQYVTEQELLQVLVTYIAIYLLSVRRIYLRGQAIYTATITSG